MSWFQIHLDQVDRSSSYQDIQEILWKILQRKPFDLYFAFSEPNKQAIYNRKPNLDQTHTLSTIWDTKNKRGKILPDIEVYQISLNLHQQSNPTRSDQLPSHITFLFQLSHPPMVRVQKIFTFSANFWEFFRHGMAWQAPISNSDMSQFQLLADCPTSKLANPLNKLLGNYHPASLNHVRQLPVSQACLVH